MNTINAEYSQSLIDICLQLNGSLDNLVALAALNDVAVESTVEAQAQIHYDSAPSVPKVAKTFQLTGTRVVTGNASLEPLVVVAGETSNGRKLPFPFPQPLGNQYQPVYGQSLLDTCLQLNGSLDNLVALAVANDATLTTEPSLSEYLVFDTDAQATSTIASRFSLTNTYVVTLGATDGTPLSIIQAKFEPEEYQPEEYA